MKVEKRTRSIEKCGGFNLRKYDIIKANMHFDPEIVEIVTLLKESVDCSSTEKMYDVIERINRREICTNDIENLLDLNFCDIIQECLEYLAIKISPCSDRFYFNLDIMGSGVLEIKVVKLILNIFLDISEFQDQSQLLDPDFIALKVRFLIDGGIGGNLLFAIESVEEAYIRNMESELFLMKRNKTAVSCDLTNHERELLYESVLVTYFQLLESTIEIDPKHVSKRLMDVSGLFEWLIKVLDDEDRYIVDEISSLKMEILSVIFQFIQLSDIDINDRSVFIDTNLLMKRFLIVLTNFALRSCEVRGIKEKEFIHNMVDIICNFLFDENLRRCFSRLQGLELMVKLMKEKTFLRTLSVKVISFALIEKGEMNNKFVQILIFAFLAHSSKCLIIDKHYTKNRKQQDTDEHLCSIVKSLLRFCTGNYHEVLINKLREDNHLRLKYFLVLRKYYTRKVSQALENADDLDDDENQIDIIETLALDAGLFIVQLIDLITVYTIYFEKESAQSFEKDVLVDYDIKLDDLKKSIGDYSSSLNAEEMAFNNRMLELLKSK